MDISGSKSDLLGLVSTSEGKKKAEGHWIGRFSREEYSALSKYFGRERVEPKDMKALFMGLTTGKVALYDPNRYDLTEK